MKKPMAIAVVAQAMGLLGRTPPISYAEMDCQKFVRACVTQAGGDMRFAGSNDMYRNACAWVGTLAEARAAGKLVPGALLFIVAQDGGEPARYRADGLGNASHVGLYLGAEGAEVAHSSASRGQVAASTLQNGWTHVGLAEAIDYGDGVPQEAARGAVVIVPPGEGLRMRAAPRGDGQYMQRVPSGTAVMVTARQNGYARAAYQGHVGWLSEAFLRYDGQEAAPEIAGSVEGPRDAMDKLLAVYADLAEWIEARP